MSIVPGNGETPAPAISATVFLCHCHAASAGSSEIFHFVLVKRFIPCYIIILIKKVSAAKGAVRKE